MNFIILSCKLQAWSPSKRIISSLLCSSSLTPLPVYNMSKMCYFSLLNGKVEQKYNLKEKSICMETRCNFWETFPYWRPNTIYKKDKITEPYKMIYNARISNYIFYGQLTAMLTSAAGCALLANNIYCSLMYGQIIDFGLFDSELEVAISASALIFLNFLLFLGAQRAPLRIYYSEETDDYVFIFLGINPFVIRKVVYFPGQITECKRTVISSIFGQHLARNKRIIIRDHCFRYPIYYNMLLGYQTSDKHQERKTRNME